MKIQSSNQTQCSICKRRSPELSKLMLHTQKICFVKLKSKARDIKINSNKVDIICQQTNIWSRQYLTKTTDSQNIMLVGSWVGRCYEAMLFLSFSPDLVNSWIFTHQPLVLSSVQASYETPPQIMGTQLSSLEFPYPQQPQSTQFPELSVERAHLQTIYF